MSSDPNTPDFDSMSPEEMMAWMETLAKRQGADSAGFTTAADEEIDEIDPDTVDDEILNQRYIPDGWTEERWQAQLAKEEVEKQERKAKATSTQPAIAQSKPEPEPAVASSAVSADGTPDYDNMSPEELMEWMESLAKRQGADEGFTTKAEMTIAEIDPDTVDESIRNKKYVPGNMSEKEWDAYLEKEAAAKQAKQTRQPEPELIYDEDDDDEDYDDEELAYVDDEIEAEFDSEEIAPLNLDDLPIIDIHEEETRVAPSNPMSWLENLAGSDEESEELDIPDLSGFGDDIEDLGGLEALAQQDADNDPMSWLSSLAGESEGTPDFDLSDLSAGLEGLEAFALSDDEDEDEELDLAFELDLEEDEEDEDESIVSLGEIDDPVSFLETLANLEGAPDDELSTDHNMEIPDLDSFFAGVEDDDDDDEIDMPDFLEDTQPSEELEMAWMDDDPNSIENPEAWLEALAEHSGDDTGQMPRFTDDDEDEDDDEEFLEDELDHDVKVIDALNSGKDVSPEDIQNFFLGAFKKAEEFAHLDDGSGDDEPEGEVESAVEIDVPDWLQELGVASPSAQAALADEDDLGEDLMADVLADLDGEEVAAEQIDIPDWLTGDSDDDDDEVVAEQIDIPDWLTGDSEDEDEIVAEQIDMPDWLTDESDDDDEYDDEDDDIVAEQVGIPDWLSEGEEDDSGDVIADIIADAHNIATGESTVISTDSGQQIEVDPNDTWTQAFLMEDREEDAEEWYTQRLSAIGDEDLVPVGKAPVPIEPEPELPTAQVTSPAGSTTLEPADLPTEEELPEGLLELAPAWLIGDGAVASVDAQPELELVIDDASDDIPSWLADSISEDEDIEIPDWLNEDSGEDAIPDWLADAGVSQIEPAAIPDWLNDTLEEPVEVVAAQVVKPVEEPKPAPIAVIPTPKPAVDVSGAIKAAQEKVVAGNLDEALVEYESVVRANDSVDVVIKDLQKLTNNDKTKKNPALYRVLGDAQMRHGDLQDALDTYRRALNLL